MLRTRIKGKWPNNTTASDPAKRSRKENLTQDDIPSIVKAVMDAMHARAKPEIRGESHTTCINAVTQGSSIWHNTNSQRRSGHQVTHNNANSQASYLVTQRDNISPCYRQH